MDDIATRDGIIDCYRTFFDRKPENESVIENHLRGRLKIVEVAKLFADSVEYRSRFISCEHFSLEKCHSEKYLLKGLDAKSATACFLHNYSTLNSCGNGQALRQIARSRLELLFTKRRHEYRVSLGIPLSIIHEGELSLELETEGAAIQTLGFSFVPGWVFDIGAHDALLISRMQGHPGVREVWKRTAKDFYGVSPQMILFECILGIAEAMNVDHILGVGAERQLSYTQPFDQTFKGGYDKFFVDRGVARGDNGIYVYCPRRRPGVNVALSPAHRLAAVKRRTIRAEIADKAAASWRNLIGVPP